MRANVSSWTQRIPLEGELREVIVDRLARAVTDVEVQKANGLVQPIIKDLISVMQWLPENPKNQNLSWQRDLPWALAGKSSFFRNRAEVEMIATRACGTQSQLPNTTLLHSQQDQASEHEPYNRQAVTLTSIAPSTPSRISTSRDQDLSTDLVSPNVLPPLPTQRNRPLRQMGIVPDQSRSTPRSTSPIMSHPSSHDTWQRNYSVIEEASGSIIQELGDVEYGEVFLGSWSALDYPSSMCLPMTRMDCEIGTGSGPQIY